MPDYLKGAEYTSKVEFTDNEFPKLFIFQNQPTQINQFSNSVSLNFRFLDVAEGINNKQRRDYEIKSDMQLAASILFDLMKKDDIILSNVDISVQPIYIAGGDGLSGVEANVVIPLTRPCSIDIPDFAINSQSYTISVGTNQVVSISDVATGDDIRFIGASTSGDIAITFNEAKTIMTLTSDGASGLYIVNFSVTNGVKTKSSVIAINVTSASASGIQYASYELLHSGQEISYFVGDEGWRFQNDEYKSHNVLNPAKIARLDPDAANPRITLIDDNIFGNKNRYTAADGSQNYTKFAVGTSSPQFALFLDHYFGMAIVAFYDTNITSYWADFSQAVAAAATINQSGYSGFSVMSVNEMRTLAYSHPDYTFNEAPLFYDLASGLVNTSTAEITVSNTLQCFLRGATIRGILALSGITQTRQFFFAKNIQSILQP